MYSQADEEEALLAGRGLCGGVGGYSQDVLDKVGYRSGQRRRVSVHSAGQCLFGPWLLFCLVYALRSFRLRFDQPLLCNALTVACGLVVLALGYVAAVAAVQNLRGSRREPSWVIFAFLTTLTAYVLGAILGGLNYSTNLHWYYSSTTLNEYWGVDPSRSPSQQLSPGQQFMDAGLVHFSENATLDLGRSMGFRDEDTYCVAPITVKDAGAVLPLEVYDFWAVGLDCCSPNVADFHCGEHLSPQVHSGLRVLDDSRRDFFRLAVQQAQAAHSIKARHPLFFYWTSDARAERNSFLEEGYKYYLVGMLVHFGWQSLAVVLAASSFASQGCD